MAGLAADLARTAAEFGAEADTLDARAWAVPVHLPEPARSQRAGRR